MKRVMIVEEDAERRQAAAQILHELDCDVETAADGRSALRRLRGRPPDACLVSNTLAGMPAIGFVHECRQRRGLEKMPIVIMAVTPRAAIEAIREGAQGCVRKPVDSGSVYAALDSVLH